MLSCKTFLTLFAVAVALSDFTTNASNVHQTDCEMLYDVITPAPTVPIIPCQKGSRSQYQTQSYTPSVKGQSATQDGSPTINPSNAPSFNGGAYTDVDGSKTGGVTVDGSVNGGAQVDGSVNGGAQVDVDGSKTGGVTVDGSVNGGAQVDGSVNGGAYTDVDSSIYNDVDSVDDGEDAEQSDEYPDVSLDLGIGEDDYADAIADAEAGVSNGAEVDASDDTNGDYDGEGQEAIDDFANLDGAIDTYSDDSTANAGIAGGLNGGLSIGIGGNSGIALNVGAGLDANAELSAGVGLDVGLGDFHAGLGANAGLKANGELNADADISGATGGSVITRRLRSNN